VLDVAPGGGAGVGGLAVMTAVLGCSVTGSLAGAPLRPHAASATARVATTILRIERLAIQGSR
jgi:hypothetical protein